MVLSSASRPESTASVPANGSCRHPVVGEHTSTVKGLLSLQSGARCGQRVVTTPMNCPTATGVFPTATVPMACSSDNGL